MAIEVSTNGQQLQRLRRRIEDWRLTRGKLGRMPEELWAEAASLACRHGVASVARALNVGYQSLQQRAAGRRGCGGAARSVSAGFVELSGAELTGVAAAGVGTVIEVASVDGARLTVRLAGPFDVAATVRAFLAARG